MALDLVILGPPGAGKGTQAKKIAEYAGIPPVSTGEMLRAAIAAGSHLGKQVEEIVSRGDLVSDELMIEVIRERLSQPNTAEGFVLDGFPRTLPQAEGLDRMLQEIDRGELSVVLHFQIPNEMAERRLLDRGHEEGRTDDTPEIIRHRIEVQRVPEPLIAYYRAKGILVGIHADRPVEEVFAEVRQTLNGLGA